MKRNLMKNAIYNEYNVDELETSFKFVSSSRRPARDLDRSSKLVPTMFFFFQINWHLLLSGLFPTEPKSHEVLLVHDPSYIRKLGRIISLFEPR